MVDHSLQGLMLLEQRFDNIIKNENFVFENSTLNKNILNVILRENK